MTYDPKPPPPIEPVPPAEPEDSGDVCMKCGKPIKFYFYIMLCDACLEAAEKEDK